ncbi:MAG: sugar transferase [Thermoanaerobaculia bacterium]|nr:sugar transferase [Thermoanaerobaculia bacterium]
MLNPQDRFSGWRLRRYAGDALVAVLAWYGAAWLRIHVPLPGTMGLLPPDRLALMHQANLVLIPLQLLLLYFFGFYDRPDPRPRAEVFVRLFGVCLAELFVLSTFIVLADRTFPRSVLVVFFLANLGLLVLWRWLDQALYRPRRRRIALVGGGQAARELEEGIEEHHYHGLEVVGHIIIPGENGDPSELRSPALGPLDRLPELVAEDRFDALVLVPPSDTWETAVLDQVAQFRPGHLSVLLLPGPIESLIGRMRYRWVSDLPLIEVVTSSDRHRRQPLKRVFDLVAGSVLLVLSLPAMLGATLAVSLTSRGPVFYRQTRIGRDQKPFTLLKFRTMEMEAETGGEVLARVDDPRLTPVGGFLRKIRCDELPQLFQVLTGDMSLVGPRPERPGFVSRYLDRVPGYAERFRISPGLTGLAQVNGDYHSSPENKLRYDLAYIANMSLWLDLSILFRTVKIVLTTRGI